MITFITSNIYILLASVGVIALAVSLFTHFVVHFFTAKDTYIKQLEQYNRGLELRLKGMQDINEQYQKMVQDYLDKSLENFKEKLDNLKIEKR